VPDGRAGQGWTHSGGVPWGVLGCRLRAVCPCPRYDYTGARCYRLRTPLRAL